MLWSVRCVGSMIDFCGTAGLRVCCCTLQDDSLVVRGIAGPREWVWACLRTTVPCSFALRRFSKPPTDGAAAVGCSCSSKMGPEERRGEERKS